VALKFVNILDQKRLQNLWKNGFEILILTTGFNPTTVSYNASVVKNNTTSNSTKNFYLPWRISGHRLRRRNRRPWVPISPGCKVFRTLCIAMLFFLT
jgi:hypothetical protein